MYIIKYMYWERDPRTLEPYYSAEHNEEVSADRLKDAMMAYHTNGLNHDLYKYTQRQIYDVINTEE